jgi:hypothetical protein
VVGYSSHNRKAYRLLNGRGAIERTDVVICDETRVSVTAEPNQGHEEAADTAPELSLNTTASGSEAIESTEHDSSTLFADQQDIMPHERCAEYEEQSTQSGDREDRRYPSRIRHPPERWGAYSEPMPPLMIQRLTRKQMLARMRRSGQQPGRSSSNHSKHRVLT